MVKMRYALENDKGFWFKYDEELSEQEFLLKIREKRAYVVSNGNESVGIMRYNLMWDIIPFLTLIYFPEAKRGERIRSRRDVSLGKRNGWPWLQNGYDIYSG
ncbi:hypothetical protein AZF37_00715 [endosymbiont 'TC1' of Trimyema compressum]|uniref:hypothetical protein n=1 Tax=endosymbiont 'TC1' of Trimyema compressum TaxID=243899 RepID=UPI0007F175E6|nr:hypothetical protein [endosymbiont 'TC1' of Trimyema compressum]AMP19893.1 hypothetical protein AZF37_00715 [endosymbiont 'TC1' of Trimyema compressum]